MITWFSDINKKDMELYQTEIKNVLIFHNAREGGPRDTEVGVRDGGVGGVSIFNHRERPPTFYAAGIVLEFTYKKTELL